MSRQIQYVRHHESSDALCRYVLGLSDTVLLSFSCGKDAIASWIQLRRHGFRVVPFYLYLVPDLAFVEKSILYYEDFFETKIHRLPHPSLYRMLHERVFQPPERWQIIEDLSLPVWEYGEVEDQVREDCGLPADVLTAKGVRTADSPDRLASVRRHGSLTPNKRSFLPVYDWRIADVKSAIIEAGVRLPIDYRLFGRTFDGVDYRFLEPISRHFPDDYERILEWFPLARLEILRRQWRAEAA